MSTKPFWFFNTRTTILVSSKDSRDGVSVIEHRVPYGDSPPLHIHRTEDEIFHILEGDFRVHVQGAEHRFGPGDIFVAPQGVPHTYRAESPAGGRMLTITAHGEFEGFVRAVGRPAQGPGLPEPAGAPTPEALQALVALASQHGIDLIGPPLA